MTGRHRGGEGRPRNRRIYIATNHGVIGGGEVMLLRIAASLRSQSYDVSVIAPSHPAQLATSARDAGLTVIELEAHDRSSWMRQLRRWDRTQRDGLLWCNGLPVALATAGRAGRIVHLHQKPLGLHRILAEVARVGALMTLLPSEDAVTALPGATAFPNWTASLPSREPRERHGGPFVLGFLGRPSPAKGVLVLLEALRQLDADKPGAFRLVVAGEPHFVSAVDRERTERAITPIEHLVDRPGWVDPEDFHSQIDVLVVPSVAPESFGLVAAEAMAARVPLVVSDAGALPEVVGADYPYIVAAGDPSSLASAVWDLASGRGAAPVDALYTRWKREFSPEAGAGRLAALVSSLP